jgi:putative transposase
LALAFRRVHVHAQGETKYLWRAVEQEGEVLENFVIKERDRAAALKFLHKLMNRHGCAKAITTDGLRSYKAAMKELGIAERQKIGRWPTTGWRTHTSPSDDENGPCCGSGA